MTKLINGLEFTETLTDSDHDILSKEACSFLAGLVDEFAERRRDLLKTRSAWQTTIDSGALPDFREDTKHIRESNWTVKNLPEDLLDRRVEITGPTDRKMVINALNADVKVFMADFEDALSPTWRNLIEGQTNLRDAVDRTINFKDAASGKQYRLNKDPAVLIARVRGLHLDEKHILRDGKPIPGCLMDFALYLFHNHEQLKKNNSGPYFYLPKLEHCEEARWWNDVFVRAQEKLELPIGTIKATCLIETLPAVFEMDEILYELKDHAAALNCGRWDYIFSYIKTLKTHTDRMLPDRHSVGMDKPFLDAYSRLLIKTCHKRGALAMGGMSAFLPAKTSDEDAANKEKVRKDKQREADNGHDGSWVAHPALSDIVNTVYSNAFKPGERNQLNITRNDDTDITAAELLSTPDGPFTDEGLRNNIRVALQYIEAWLGGLGAVAIYGLMEDAATAEISRASIWQWIKNSAVLDNGEVMSAAYFKKVKTEEMAVVRKEVGEKRWISGNFGTASELLESFCLSDGFDTFLTLQTYRQI